MKTSVLINNYNNGPYLRATVESALNQTQPPGEVIVYDDGSSDNSLEILRSFGNRITVIAGQRTSLPSRAAQARAVHQAFLVSSGDLHFLLDGDDLFLPEKIAAYSAVFAQNPDAVLIQAPMKQIDSQEKPLGDTAAPFKHQTDYLAATYRHQDADFYYPTSALAFSRAFLEKTLPLDYSDDNDLAVDSRLSSIAPLLGRVITLEKSHTVWRRHSNAHTALANRTKRLYQETLKRARFFNAYARAHGHRTISVWRCPRFYRQLVRAYSPDWSFNLYWKLTHKK